MNTQTPFFFQPIDTFSSPHFSPMTIPVEFLILHYTALSLKGSLKIFLSKTGSKVSTHLLIDEKGRLYELVKCWKGTPQKAFHGGQSRWKDFNEKIWKNFNDFSIGIELVNPNGNLFPYREEQYETLFKTVKHLQNIYPNLKKPYRILGHEHIAGFRGKVDPGRFFDWKRLYKNIYKKDNFHLSSKMTEQQVKSLGFCRRIKDDDALSQKVSLILEKPFPFWIKKFLIKNSLQKKK